jgi:hypothetical protein
MRYRWNHKKCFRNLWEITKKVIAVTAFLAVASFNPFGII